MTRLQSFTDPKLFVTAAVPFWQANLAKSNLQWALAEKYAQGGTAERAFIMYEHDELLAVGLQTDLPRPLILQASGPLNETAVQLIENYCEELPGLIITKTLAESYLPSSRYEPIATVSLLSYQLDELIPGFDRPTGELLPAAAVPIELIADWLEKFILFIEETGNDGNYLQQAHNLVASGNLYVYLMGGTPVSMAASTRSQGGVAAVNYVFTPEDLRMNGYAYSCVGELSKLLLQTHDCCILYADKNYPASNRVYQKLGYYETGESLEVIF